MPALSHSWEAADGFPPEVQAILSPVLGPVELLLALPEHKTPLPGGRRDSQADVFALGRYRGGLVACTVEGKVDEPFGPTVGDWMRNASPGKIERLAYVCGLLGITECPPDVHYQLLHRTAAALIEAERFCATDAAMVVHSFSPQRRWFEAYERFAELLVPRCRACRDNYARRTAAGAWLGERGSGIPSSLTTPAAWRTEILLEPSLRL